MNLSTENNKYNLDLTNSEELKDFREWLEKTYHESSKKNVNLHVITETCCYPAEINESKGSLKDCLDELFGYFTKPEDPTYEIAVYTKEIEEIWNEDLIFSTRSGVSTYEKGVRKLIG
ncbi:gp607 [Bacillus phage G]|uniref:Gp607 n=1 Tax=Bacillus phage G TaxID=2884420 RepID=G3MAY7_9CAUD|nr:gp607 [Bacillus phage G]AEO93852.1 gp607 [Bacillus phage G]